LLVQAERVARRIENFRGDLGRLRADGLRHLATARDDGLTRRTADVRGGDFDVTNLAVSKSRRHENDYR
jgi:hypothetical protein